MRTSPLQTILTAGLLCGVLDGISAIAVFGFFGRKPVQIFQGIASAVLGPGAFHGGPGAAALGVVLHFVVALGAASVYYTASRGVAFLIDHAMLSGVLYGIGVHLFMSFVAIPLSAIGRRPFEWRSFAAVLIVHMIVVGPSISLVVRRYAR